MKEFFANCLTAGAIRFRDALYGGRTEVFKMKLDSDNEHAIKYLDVISLYPSQMFTKRFPVSQPKCHVLNKEVSLASRRDLYDFEHRLKDPNTLNGIMKCLLLPPRECRIPAIQARFEGGNGNLLFPLCRSCSNNHEEGRVYRDFSQSCPHHDWKEKAWVTTLTLPEIEMALDNNYVIKKILRSYSFEK